MDRQDRIGLLQRRIKDKGLGCALLFYSRDIFYYTGTAQPSYLLVLPDDYFLFVRSGNDFAVKDVFISTEHIQEERKLETIYAKNLLLSGKQKNCDGTGCSPGKAVFRVH